MPRSLLALTATGLVLCGAVPPCPAADTVAITAESAPRVGEIATLSGHTMAVFSLAFSPDGTKVASAGIDKTVRVWDVATQKQTVEFKGHTKQVTAVAFSADGASVVSAGYDQSILTFDAASGKQTGVVQKGPKGEFLLIENVNNAFRPDGARFATVPEFGVVMDVWDVKAGTRADFDKGAAQPKFHRPAWSGDGNRLAVTATKGDDASSVEVWDFAGSKWETSIPAPAKARFESEAVALDATGTTVAVVDVHSSRILLFDVKSGKPGGVLAGHAHDADSEQTLVLGLAFSPDGKLLASASYDKTVRLWDTASGKQLVSLPSHKNGAGAVAFSRDGARVASADLDGTVQVFGLPAK